MAWCRQGVLAVSARASTRRCSLIFQMPGPEQSQGHCFQTCIAVGRLPWTGDVKLRSHSPPARRKNGSFVPGSLATSGKPGRLISSRYGYGSLDCYSCRAATALVYSWTWLGTGSQNSGVVNANDPESIQNTRHDIICEVNTTSFEMR